MMYVAVLLAAVKPGALRAVLNNNNLTIGLQQPI
jgi:hypothetical protein